MFKNGISTKAQEELAIFEHSFELIAQRFRLTNDLHTIKSYIFEHDLADFLIGLNNPLLMFLRMQNQRCNGNKLS